MAGKKCSALTFKLKKSPKDALAKVKKDTKGEMEIKGDESSGHIKALNYDITGTYKVKDQTITINMVDDAAWITCSMINAKVSGYFKNL